MISMLGRNFFNIRFHFFIFWRDKWDKKAILKDGEEKKREEFQETSNDYMAGNGSF